MSLRLWSTPGLACAFLAMGAIPAMASSIVTATFTDPVSWQNAVTVNNEITFDGVAPLGSFTNYGSGGYTNDGVTFLGDNGAGYLETIVDSGFQSPYNNWGTGGTLTSAPNYLTSGNYTLKVTLPASITAFGVDLGSFNPNGMSVQVALNDGEAFTVPTTNRPNLTFFGITTSAPVTYVDFSLVNANGNGGELVMDNLAIGSADQSAAPEAGTLGLIGLGLITLPALYKRQTL